MAPAKLVGGDKCRCCRAGTKSAEHDRKTTLANLIAVRNQQPRTGIMRKDLYSAPAAPLLKNILANAQPFRMLTADQIERLMATSLVLRPRSGTVLVEQGAAPVGLHVVIFGQVKVYFSRNDGAEKTLAILGHNDCFGIAETFLGRPHLAAVATIGDAMVVCLPKEEVFALAQQNFGFAQQLLSATAHQMHCLIHDINRYSALNAAQRVVGFLLRQYSRHTGQTIELCASKALIASRLGITGETFSRLLHEFTTQGLIEVRGRRIKILDVDRMSQLQPA